MLKILIAIATLPALLLMLLIYKKDAPKKEPIGQLAKAFALGVASIFPALGIEMLLSALMPEGLSALEASCYDAFVVAALTEECCKMAALLLAVRKCRDFDEYFDGIVYSAFVALGFATFENFTYILGAGDLFSLMTTGLARGILAVPAHFLFGVTMGYFFAHYRFSAHLRGLNIALALLLPVLLHGTYDALLMYSDTLSDDTAEGSLLHLAIFVLFMAFDVLMWLWGLNRIKRLRQLSIEQHPEPQNPFTNRTFPL